MMDFDLKYEPGKCTSTVVDDVRKEEERQNYINTTASCHQCAHCQRELSLTPLMELGYIEKEIVENAVLEDFTAYHCTTHHAVDKSMPKSNCKSSTGVDHKYRNCSTCKRSEGTETLVTRNIGPMCQSVKEPVTRGKEVHKLYRCKKRGRPPLVTIYHKPYFTCDRYIPRFPGAEKGNPNG